MSDRGRWFWRIIGVVAAILSAVSLSFVYALWKTVEFRPVAAGNTVSLDSLSLQLDLLALSLAAVGIGLGVIGLFGCQNIRDMAVAKAAEEARRTAQSYMQIDRETAESCHPGAAGGNDAARSLVRPSLYPANRFDPAAVSTKRATKEVPSDDERDRRDGGDRATSSEAAGRDGGAG